jgi:hypothetical protein
LSTAHCNMANCWDFLAFTRSFQIACKSVPVSTWLQRMIFFRPTSPSISCGSLSLALSLSARSNSRAALLSRTSSPRLAAI